MGSEDDPEQTMITGQGGSRSGCAGSLQ